jgi:acyl carrier protein
MADIESRLVDCFAATFPELDRREIRSASAGSIATWDSLAGITLISVIEEEFGVAISPDDVPDLISFELILDYLRRLSPEEAR